MEPDEDLGESEPGPHLPGSNGTKTTTAASTTAAPPTTASGTPAAAKTTTNTDMGGKATNIPSAKNNV